MINLLKYLAKYLGIRELIELLISMPKYLTFKSIRRVINKFTGLNSMCLNYQIPSKVVEMIG